MTRKSCLWSMYLSLAATFGHWKGLLYPTPQECGTAVGATAINVNVNIHGVAGAKPSNKSAPVHPLAEHPPAPPPPQIERQQLYRQHVHRQHQIRGDNRADASDDL
ncbi:hypothetical protein DFP73DRAFT_601534 [Morchella snyderi]|nr:hypothetical protein DFP73DRAFT_601534 [Morchella snyderi]